MPTASQLNRLAWTVRYLKGRQIAGQVRHRLHRRFVRYERANGAAAPSYRGCLWPPGVRFLAPGSQANTVAALREGQMSFLNSEQNIGFPPRWHCPDLPKLWQYNLHYFEWLWPLDYVDAKAMVLDWIENHPLGKGAAGWEPYPTSLRLVNWCSVFFGRFREATETDASFLRVLWRSVHRQAAWLMGHLETHLLGNHYLENATALAFVGSCFAGDDARKWFERGCAILQEQIPEQILSDGMHFERSAMYHSRVVYMLAMLMATGHGRLKALAAEPLERMLQALDLLLHPDGRIALLNDSAFGIYNEPNELMAFCHRLFGAGHLPAETKSGCFALADAGYYGWRDQEGNTLICDFGKIGPDYIPGHAHADIFSYEMSLRGHRVIVDAGVYDYECSDTRRYCRSTAAHNTVEVDGRDQCEMWGAFRVGQRGYPHDVAWGRKESGFSLAGWHDGYRRLAGRPVHHRAMQWDANSGLMVKDRITSSQPVEVVSRLHLHPACVVERTEASRILVRYPGGQFAVVWYESDLEIQEGQHFPEFGIRQPNTVLAFRRKGMTIELAYHIQNIQ
jgi:uncharacterized heparinase superfamily protein